MDEHLEHQLNEVKNRYLMPYVEVGETVLFYQGCDPSQCVPLTVTRVTPRSLDGLMFIQGNGYLSPNDNGVRYKGDPALNNPANKMMGCWDYRQSTVDYYTKETKIRHAEVRRAESERIKDEHERLLREKAEKAEKAKQGKEALAVAGKT